MKQKSAWFVPRGARYLRVFNGAMLELLPDTPTKVEDPEIIAALRDARGAIETTSRGRPLNPDPVDVPEEDDRDLIVATLIGPRGVTTNRRGPDTAGGEDLSDVKAAARAARTARKKGVLGSEVEEADAIDCTPPPPRRGLGVVEEREPMLNAIELHGGRR